MYPNLNLLLINSFFSFLTYLPECELHKGIDIFIIANLESPIADIQEIFVEWINFPFSTFSSLYPQRPQTSIVIPGTFINSKDTKSFIMRLILSWELEI